MLTHSKGLRDRGTGGNPSSPGPPCPALHRLPPASRLPSHEGHSSGRRATTGSSSGDPKSRRRSSPVPAATSPPARKISGFASARRWELSPTRAAAASAQRATCRPPLAPLRLPARLATAADTGSHGRCKVAALRQPCSPNKTPSLCKKPQPHAFCQAA